MRSAALAARSAKGAKQASATSERRVRNGTRVGRVGSIMHHLAADAPEGESRASIIDRPVRIVGSMTGTVNPPRARTNWTAGGSHESMFGAPFIDDHHATYSRIGLPCCFLRADGRRRSLAGVGCRRSHLPRA